MRSEAWVPLLATVISFEFTMALWRRWRDSRRSYLRSWLLSLAFFTAGTAALWYGVAFGWSSPTFRLYYLCGAFLAAPWLAMGELELLLPPKTARVIWFMLALISLDMALVIGAVPFVEGGSVAGFAIPHGKGLFPVPVRWMVMLANVIGTFVVVGGTVYSGWRSRGKGPAAAARFRGTMLITVGVLFAAAGGTVTFLGQADALAGSLAIGVGLMYYGFVVASRRPGAHRAAHHAETAHVSTVEPGRLADRDSEAAASAPALAGSA
jgi:hypothetical protein